MNERIAIGVDAGGSTTVAALSSDGAYRTSAYGGPANANTVGLALAASTIVATVREVAAGAAVGSIFVGAAGAGRMAARDALAAALRAHFSAATIAVEDDLRVALRAGIATGPGVVLVAGTGSVAYAEHAERRVRVGGAGYLAGDEGSAFAIGLGALRRLARAYDGRERPDETSVAVAAAFEAPDLEALLEALYGGPPDVARIAALAPLVIAGADRGDRGATKLVQGAAQELGDLARAAARGAGLAEPVVVFAGGLLRTNSLLSFLLEARVTNELPGVQIVRVREEPARAALRLAGSPLSAGGPLPSTEAAAATRDLDTLDALALVALLAREQTAATEAVARATPAIAHAVDAIVARLKAGGALHYVGAGTSGRLAMLDAAECPPTFGTPPSLVVAHVAGGAAALLSAIEGAEDDAVAGAREMHRIGARDAVVGISASGSAPYVLAALRAARANGALTIGVANDPRAPLLGEAEIAIALETGAEPIAGSTRLKAGTAQKLVLNALSTATMIRLGKVHDNLMVDVCATNAKLRARALRLVASLARVDATRAQQLLDAADGSVKVAVVMAARTLDADGARRALVTTDGFLRPLLRREP